TSFECQVEPHEATIPARTNECISHQEWLPHVYRLRSRHIEPLLAELIAAGQKRQYTRGHILHARKRVQYLERTVIQPSRTQNCSQASNLRFGEVAPRQRTGLSEEARIRDDYAFAQRFQLLITEAHSTQQPA